MEASDPFDGDPYSLPSPVSDRVLRAIGLLVVEWGVFAYRMELLIWWTLGLNEAEGRAVTTHLNDRARLDLIVTLALDRIDGPDSRDILAKKKRQAIASLIEDRNKVIHSTRMGSGGKYKGPTRWQRAQARSGVKVFSEVQGVSTTVEHIQGIVTRSRTLAEDLRDFLDDHGCFAARRRARDHHRRRIVATEPGRFPPRGPTSSRSSSAIRRAFIAPPGGTAPVGVRARTPGARS